MIAPDVVAHIAQEVERVGIDESAIPGLRASHPDIHFTYCSDDDIVNAKPVLERETFNIYLVDGREHCLCLTNDHDIASGLVLAEIYPEED